jgi:PBSX family phage terminase large subunit
MKIKLNRNSYSEHFKPVFDSQNRLMILMGGRGSGKTDHAIMKLILDSFRLKYFKCAYINKEFANIRDNQFSTFKKIINRMGLQDYFKFYNGDYRIINTLTNNSFIPKGLDDPEKTKGIDDVTHIFWDEISKGNKNDFLTLNKLLRTPLAEYLQFIICFNPVSDKHWLREFFFDEKNSYKAKDHFKDVYLNHSTYKDNEFIDQQAYLDTLMMDNYDQASIDCDVNGLWGNIRVENLFISTFKSDIHVPKIPIEFERKLLTYVSVDFNVNPMTAIVLQTDLHLRKIAVINEYRSEDSNVYELCKWIESNYNTNDLFITGDSSGNNRHAYSVNSLSGYQIIKNELKLNFSQMKVSKGKPQGYVQTKRLIGNAVFARHSNVTISNAPYLVEDLENVTVKPDGSMDKKGDLMKTHLLDCLLDCFYTICKGNVNNIR